MKKISFIIWFLLSVQTCVADNSPVGTWSGTWEDDEGSSGTTNSTVLSNGTISGTSYEPGWGTMPFTGTYTFNPATGSVTANLTGTSTVLGYPVRYTGRYEGRLTGDTMNGDEWETLDAYYEGAWHRQWTNLHGTWSFTRTSIPSKATNPSPSNGASNRSITVDISWSNGGGATSYNVYFGTDSTPDSSESKGNQPGRVYDPGTLVYNTTYYWRIDAKNSNGTTTGNVWRFTTGSPPNVYVSVTGSDSHGTGAQSNPYKTVQKALQVAGNGAKIIIFAGTYPENITMNKQVTIEAQGGLVRIGR